MPSCIYPQYLQGLRSSVLRPPPKIFGFLTTRKEDPLNVNPGQNVTWALYNEHITTDNTLFHYTLIPPTHSPVLPTSNHNAQTSVTCSLHRSQPPHITIAQSDALVFPDPLSLESSPPSTDWLSVPSAILAADDRDLILSMSSRSKCG